MLKTRLLFKNLKNLKMFLRLWFPVTIFAIFDDNLSPFPATITRASIDEAIGLLIE